MVKLFLFLTLIVKCYFAHALGDFAFQSDSMAKGKNRHNFDITKVPKGQKPINCWFFWMSAHALVNGALFYFFTGCLFIGILESLLHFFIDVIKCENKTNPIQDQLLHCGCIIFYSIFQLGWCLF